MDKQDMKVN